MLKGAQASHPTPDNMEVEFIDVNKFVLEDDDAPPELPSTDADPGVWVEYRVKHKEHEISRQAAAKKRKADASILKEAYGKLSVRRGIAKA